MNGKFIIAHGDLDGETSAALLAEKHGIETEDLNVVFTQPFLVDQVVIPDEVDQVYVVDIAINNRDPAMTEKFIANLGAKLVRWYDHHEGWPEHVVMGGVDFERDVSDMKYYDFIINTKVKACAILLSEYFDIRVMDAIVADTREGELSHTGQLIERAVKSDMSNDQIRTWAVKLLMGDETYRHPLEGAARAYQLVENETYRLECEYRVNKTRGDSIETQMWYRDQECPVAGCDNKGVFAFVDATKSNHQYDLTQLLLKGQELATFAIVKTINPNDEEMVTVATKSKTNLVELFDLKSGALFRVTLPAARLEEVIDKLNEVI